MTDRRRINGPAGGTSLPVFASTISGGGALQFQRPTRVRSHDEPRKMFIRTGITPTASGSAYLELPANQSTNSDRQRFLPSTSSLKLSCAVHGPKPLPRSSPFSPHLVLTAHVKFAPFATRQRRGYLRDSTERDLGAHLETALRGVVIGERWPKSGADVIITILEGEEDCWWGDELLGGSSRTGFGSWGLFNVLAACITVSSAALADAGIDCVDLVCGGVAASVSGSRPTAKSKDSQSESDEVIMLDPSPNEHQEIRSACVVGYLPARDEVTELWLVGNASSGAEKLVDRAIEAAVATSPVLVQAIQDAARSRYPETSPKDDMDMEG